MVWWKLTSLSSKLPVPKHNIFRDKAAEVEGPLCPPESHGKGLSSLHGLFAGLEGLSCPLAEVLSFTVSLENIYPLGIFLPHLPSVKKGFVSLSLRSCNFCSRLFMCLSSPIRVHEEQTRSTSFTEVFSTPGTWQALGKQLSECVHVRVCRRVGESKLSKNCNKEYFPLHSLSISTVFERKNNHV